MCICSIKLSKFGESSLPQITLISGFFHHQNSETKSARSMNFIFKIQRQKKLFCIKPKENCKKIWKLKTVVSVFFIFLKNCGYRANELINSIHSTAKERLQSFSNMAHTYMMITSSLNFGAWTHISPWSIFSAQVWHFPGWVASLTYATSILE